MIAWISRALAARLHALAAASPEREVCGLLLGARLSADAMPSPSAVRAELGKAGARLERGMACERVTDILPAANVATDPAARFEIDPAALFAALRAERAGGARILGHYHSHPRGPAAPSACDAALAHEAGRLWLILGEGRLTAWRAVPGGPVHGAFEPVDLRVAPDGCETGH